MSLLDDCHDWSGKSDRIPLRLLFCIVPKGSSGPSRHRPPKAFLCCALGKGDCFPKGLVVLGMFVWRWTGLDLVVSHNTALFP